MKNNDLLASAKLTSKGQITIPKVIREKLKLDEGNLVVFYEDENNNVKMLNKNNCKVISDNKSESSIVKRGSKK